MVCKLLSETVQIAAHYYPACPEPELTFGSLTHADLSSIAILLQDQTGGLQVWNQNQWVNVPPLDGGLVIIVEEFMQVSMFTYYLLRLNF